MSTPNARFFAKVRAELAKPPGQRKLTRVQVAGLLQLAEEGERLRPFVRHREGCAVRVVTEYGGGIEDGCDCGLDGEGRAGKRSAVLPD